MIGIETPSPFVDNVGAILGAADLNALEDNAILLDQLSYRPAPALDHMAGEDTAAADLHTDDDFRLWQGSILYRAGMEDLVITGAASLFGSTALDVYIDGVLDSTITLGASFTHTIDISTGYSDGDFIDVLIWTNGNTTDTSTILITRVYGTPIDVDTAWPSIPTFAGTYNADRLNDMVDACQHLWERINAVGMPPTIAHLWKPATHKIDADYTLYHGAIVRFFADDVLRVEGNVLINNAAEHYVIKLNGTTQYTSSTYSPGTYAIDASIDLSAYTIGTPIQVTIKAVVTDAGNQIPTATINSRYTFHLIRSEADSGGYPVAVPPAEFSANTSIASTTLDTRLNAIGTMLGNIYTRLNALPELWDRFPASRRRFGLDEHQTTDRERVYVHRFVRRGDRLVLRGKGVTLGWGAQIVSNSGGKVYEYKFASEESVIDGEHYRTATIYLDSLEGLFPGQPYYVMSTDLVGAWEFLS